MINSIEALRRRDKDSHYSATHGDRRDFKNYLISLMKAPALFLGRGDVQLGRGRINPEEVIGMNSPSIRKSQEGPKNRFFAPKK